MFAKRSVKDVDVRGKRVLVRVDFNVPLAEGSVVDDTRVRAALPTLRYLVDHGARVILMSHLGRPKGKPTVEFSLKPVAEHLGILLNIPVKFATDCIGKPAKEMVATLKPGECLMLENLRFHAEEEKNDEAFARELASLGDVYVNDAFGSAHRAHASTEGVTHFVKPAVAGYLMRKEIEYLSRAVTEPGRPWMRPARSKSEARSL